MPQAAATSPTSPLDSRIPRPSPTALRRAGSLRLRGERVPPHHPRAIVAINTTLVAHQHHHRRHNHLLQSQQQHQHPDHRIFPVITENGTDSPRQRSFVSTILLSFFYAVLWKFMLLAKPRRTAYYVILLLDQTLSVMPRQIVQLQISIRLSHLLCEKSHWRLSPRDLSLIARRKDNIRGTNNNTASSRYLRLNRTA